MFVFLSKFGPLFVYPLGFTCVLLVLALLAHKHQKLHTAFSIFALVVILLTSNSWVAAALTRSLEWRYLPPETLPKADVIVVLGGGTDAAEYPRSTVELNSGGDRVIYAGYLYKQGAAPHLLLSGGNISWLGSTPSTPATEMAEVLTWMDIPEEALWLQPESQNTYEDALYSAKMLKEKGINRIILVTTASHMPRSVALFEKQGLEVVPAPTDFKVTQASWDALFSGDPAGMLVRLMPNVGNLSMITAAMKEYLGMLVYRLRGWM
jgi:uncharacterized SAM-binding protein YcdF (DUF218 family)